MDTRPDPTPAALEGELAHFRCSERFFAPVVGVTYTEGVKHLAERAGAYWLIDAIVSHIKTNKRLRAERFQVWRLTLNAGAEMRAACVDADLGAVLEGGRGDGEPIVRQEIEYTDFPLRTIELWVGYNGGDLGFTIHLPSEH